MSRITDFVEKELVARQKRQNEKLAPFWSGMNKLHQMKQAEEVETETFNQLNLMGINEYGEKNWEPFTQEEYDAWGGSSGANNLFKSRASKLDRVNRMQLDFADLPGYGKVFTPEGKFQEGYKDTTDFDVLENTFRQERRLSEENRAETNRLIEEKREVDFEREDLVSNLNLTEEVAAKLNTKKKVKKFRSDYNVLVKKNDKLLSKLEKKDFAKLERFFSNSDEFFEQDGKLYQLTDEKYPEMPKRKNKWLGISGEQTKDSKLEFEEAKKEQDKYIKKGDLVFKDVTIDYDKTLDETIGDSYFLFKQLREQIEKMESDFNKLTGTVEEVTEEPVKEPAVQEDVKGPVKEVIAPTGGKGKGMITKSKALLDKPTGKETVGEVDLSLQDINKYLFSNDLKPISITEYENFKKIPEYMAELNSIISKGK